MSNEFFISDDKCFLHCELHEEILADLLKEFPIKPQVSLQAFSILIGESAGEFLANLLSQIKPGYLNQENIYKAKKELIDCLTYYIHAVMDEEERHWLDRVKNGVLQ